EKSLLGFINRFKSGNETFTRAARQGEAFGNRLFSEYSLTHHKLDRLFSTSAIRWTHGFEAVQHHARGTGSQLLSLAGGLNRLEDSRKRAARDYEESLGHQKQLNDDIVKSLDGQNKEL